MTSYNQLVAAALSRVPEVTSDDVSRRGDEVLLLDVREPEETSQGAIPGARILPRGLLERDIAGVATPDTEMVLYCASGSRSALAAATLLDMGYPNVSSLRGGFDAWKAAGLPWGDPSGLTADQRSRYARHVALPEVGESGQLQLLSARVLVVGLGGLGSPAAIYLAAAGIGTIGLIDNDVVDATNLQRQVIHNLDRVGSPKVDSAAEAIGSLNPDVKLQTYDQRLTAANATSIIQNHDIVIDCADNFPTRYLVNDAALNAQVPVVHGSIFRFEGQVTVFDPYQGPCYRCLHRMPPPPEVAPNCSDAGVLGVLPGVVGSIQAMEAIKLILGVGETLAGRMLIYDALEQDFVTLSLARDPDCPACADPDDPPPLVDYDETCRSAR